MYTNTHSKLDNNNVLQFAPTDFSIYLFDTLVSIHILGGVPINFNLCEIYNHFLVVFDFGIWLRLLNAFSNNCNLLLTCALTKGIQPFFVPRQTLSL